MPNDLFYGTNGPRDASIVIVGEAWGADEAAARQPFVGMSGRELDRMLAEAGIQRADVLCTNVFSERPYNNEAWRLFHARDGAPPNSEVRGLHPTDRAKAHLERLDAQLGAFPRRLVIATGNYPLWALTNHSGVNPSTTETEGRRVPNGIMNWRGSMTYTLAGVQCLPIIHPAAIMRQWSLRALTVHDLKARVPMALRGDWRPNPMPLFWAPPTFEQAKLKLEGWLRRAAQSPIRLVCDTETFRKTLITCIGFADSPNFAMCIPLVRKVGNSFDSWWSPEQEAILSRLIMQVITSPNILLEGQNFLYDTQYFQDGYGVTPKLDFDTMYAQHLLWPGTQKGLDYISSLYCTYHWYWKDDSKDWEGKGTVEQLLEYNCWDCVRTYEAADSLRSLITLFKMERQWKETLARVNFALGMMNRGVKIDMKRKGRLSLELAQTLSEIDAKLQAIIPQGWLPPRKKGAKPTMWYASPKQQLYVFGEILGMKIPRHRKTGNPSLGKDALPDLEKKHPEFTGIFHLLKLRRQIATFKTHFIDAKVDPDLRMRCSYNPSGTETFRFSSSANAFGRGTNLQNLSVGDEE